MSGRGKGGNRKLSKAEERNRIVNECVNERISPKNLSIKYGFPVHSIWHWVKQAGKTLPEHENSVDPAGDQFSEVHPGEPRVQDD